MQTMNISLPDQLKEFVDGQVDSGRYSSVSEYVRDLIRDDEKRKAQERLETLLMEGIQSGEPTEMTRKAAKARPTSQWVLVRGQRRYGSCGPISHRSGEN